MFSKPNPSFGCRKFESRFEDYLAGATDTELNEHLTTCENCRAALMSAKQAGDLVRGAWEPASDPGETFLMNVMGKIHQQKEHEESGLAFWAPLEFLASRVSLTAAMILLVLSVYLAEFAPRRSAPTLPARTELSSSDFPQPPADPVSNEEVLQSLVERNYGH